MSPLSISSISSTRGRVEGAGPYPRPSRRYLLKSSARRILRNAHWGLFLQPAYRIIVVESSCRVLRELMAKPARCPNRAHSRLPAPRRSCGARFPGDEHGPRRWIAALTGSRIFSGIQNVSCLFSARSAKFRQGGAAGHSAGGVVLVLRLPLKIRNSVITWSFCRESVVGTRRLAECALVVPDQADPPTEVVSRSVAVRRCSAAKSAAPFEHRQAARARRRHRRRCLSSSQRTTGSPASTHRSMGSVELASVGRGMLSVAPESRQKLAARRDFPGKRCCTP